MSMHQFKIYPLEGLDEIRFRMHRNQVRSLFNGVPEAMKNGVWDKGETDFYDAQGIRFTYDESCILQTIGLLPFCDASIFDISLKENKLKNFLKLLEGIGQKPSTLGECYYFDDLGLCILLEGKKIGAYELYQGSYKDIADERLKKMEEFYV